MNVAGAVTILTITSAFRFNADVKVVSSDGPLMTQSGHSGEISYASKSTYQGFESYAR